MQQSAAQRPLQAHALFHSVDLDETRDRVASVFCPHRLDRIGKEIDSGCIYISGATEYDDRPGAVRDVLVKMHRDWQKEMHRATAQAIEENHLPANQAHADQLVFEMVGLILAAHQQGRLMGDSSSVKRASQGFERMIQHYQQTQSEILSQ